MKKSMVKNLFKKSVHLGFTCILCASLFMTISSCENFISGADFKNQLQTDINYANASSYKIKVEAVKGTGNVKIPATGEVIQKVTDTFSIKFDPADNCRFIKWEAFSETLDDNEKISDYIEFESENTLETKVKFKKEKDDIIIRPVCPQVLQVTDFNLSNQTQTYPRDSSIILTFNKPIASECKDKLSLSIPLSDENKNPFDYFKQPEINKNQLALYSNTQNADAENFIPVTQGSSKMIALTLSSGDFYYMNNDYSEPVKVFLANDITYLYSINSETSEKSKVKFALSKENSGSLKIDDVNYDGRTVEYSIGSSFRVDYKLSDDYRFNSWKAKRTFTDENGNEKTETINALDDFYQLGLSVSFKSNENTAGYDSKEHNASTVFSINNHLDGIITIYADSDEPVQIKTELSDAESGKIKIKKEKDETWTDATNTKFRIGSSFSIRYNLESVYTFKGWEVSRTFTDNNGKSQTETLTDLSENELKKFKLAVNFGESDKTSGYDEATKTATASFTVTDYIDGIIKIKALSCEPVLIKTSLKDTESGTLKINGNTSDGSVIKSKIGSTFTVKCKFNEGYSFKSWKISRSYKDENGTNQIQTISNFTDLKNIKLSYSFADYEDTNGYDRTNNSLSGTFTVNDYIDGEISIAVETYEPVQIKTDLSDYDSGSVKINRTINYGTTENYRIGSPFTINYVLNEGYSFKGWKISRTYEDEEGTKQTETLTDLSENELKKFNLSINFGDYEDSEGYSSFNNQVNATFTVNDEIDGSLNISILSNEPVKVKTAVSDLESGEIKINGRTNDGSIANYKVGTNFTVKYTLSSGYSFKGWKISRTYKDENGENQTETLTDLSENELKKFNLAVNFGEYEDSFGYDSTNSVLGTFTITDYISGDISISVLSEKPVLIKFSLPEDDYGSLRINNSNYSDNIISYRVGTSFTLKYRPSDDYNFTKWVFKHTTLDANKPENFTEITDLNEIALEQISENDDSDESNQLTRTSTITLKVKEHIEGTIEISPKVTQIPVSNVKIDGKHGKFSPATGTYSAKLGTPVSLSFDPDGDYEFIRWSIIDENTGNELTNNDYIYISSMNDESTVYTLVAAPEEDENISLVIKPVVTERPQILSYTPLYSTSGVMKDSTIKVMFDYDMDKNSIYYTEEELEKLRNELGIAQDSDIASAKNNKGTNNYLKKFTNEKNQTEYYGYVKDDETYFKNIIIKNSKNDKNLLDHFNAPIFENERTLSITVDKQNQLPDYTTVFVSIEKDAYYKKDNRNISMSGSKKWIYQISNAVDKKAPTLVLSDSSHPFSLQDTAENDILETNSVPSLSSLASINYIKQKKLKFQIAVKDESEVASSFTLSAKRLTDENYNSISDGETQIINIPYTVLSGTDAYFSDDINLEDLDEGLYRFNFIFSDQSGNKLSYPNDNDEHSEYQYYICLDDTSPSIPLPVISDSVDTDGKIRITWNTTTGVKDFKETSIFYRLYGSSSDYTELTETTASAGFKDIWLTGGKDYDIRTVYRDFAGNERKYDSVMQIRPCKPSDLVVNASNNDDDEAINYGDTSVKLTVTKPTAGSYDGLRIRYFEEGITDEDDWEEIIIEDVDDETEWEIRNLENGKIYNFEVCAYDSDSDKYSLPYKISSAYPRFITIPAAVQLYSYNFADYTDHGLVALKEATSDFTAAKVYYSTTSDFTSASYITIPKAENTETKSITGLTAGTRYYLKVETYFENENNKVERLYGNTSTKPNPVQSFTNNTAELTNTSITVNWTKPEGNCNGYRLYYKKYSESTWNSSIDLNGENTLSYTFEELTAGEKYNIYVYSRSNNYSSTAQTLVVQTKPDEVTNLASSKHATDNTIINLSWTNPTTTFSGVKVYCATSEANLKEVTPTTYSNTTTTSHSQTGLTTGNTYYFKVRTYISDSLWTDSEVISCSTSINPVTNLNVAAYQNYPTELYVTWTNPVEFDGIRIYKSAYSSFNTSTSTLFRTINDKTTQSLWVNGLNPNSYNYIHVVAYKVVGGVEAIATSSKGCRTRPAKATNTAVTVNSPTSATVTWTNPSSTSYWYYSYLYVLQGSTTVASYKITDKTQTSYQVTDLTPGTQYTYSIRTYNDAGTIGPYDSVSSTTVPTAPTSLSIASNSTDSSASAVANSASVKLSWTAPTGNVTSYKVYYRLSSEGSYTYANTTTNTYYNITGLTAAKYYYFKVESILDGVTNLSSGSYTTTGTYTKPTVPRNLRLDSYTTTSLKFSWAAPISGVSGYRLYYKLTSASSFSYKTITSGTTTTYELTGLTPGSKYDVYVSSYISSTSYMNSCQTIYKSTKTETPNAPAVRADNGGLYITWTKPAGKVDGYYLLYKLNSTGSSGTWTSVYTTNTAYSFGYSSTLSKNTKYDFAVRAYSSDFGNSSDSSQTSFFTPPAYISNLSIWSDDGMGTIILRFNTPSQSENVYIDFFADDTYLGYGTYASNTTNCEKTITISNPRASSKTIRAATYHNNNSASGDTASWAQSYKNETYGYAPTVSTSINGNLRINGTTYNYSKLMNIITSSYKISNNTTLTGGAFPSNRTVTLSPYSVGAYQVTQQLYQAVMGSNPSYSSGSYKPVECVSWYHAIAFCNKLSVMQGLTPCYTISGYNNSSWLTMSHSKVPTSNSSTWNDARLNQSANGYYLPTEAQWEFAARGGSTTATAWSYCYAGGTTISAVGVTNTSSTANVGTKNANTKGLYDMTGNVWEWLSDWNYNVPSGTFTDPWCAFTNGVGSMNKKEEKILNKGAAFDSSKNRDVDYNSSKDTPYYTSKTVGFRVCRRVTYN